MFSTPTKQSILPINDPDSCWSIIKKNQSFLPIPKIKSTKRDENPSSIRISCMSDTHGRHRSIPIPPCDILIHSGDITKTGEIGHIKDLNDYFAELKQKNIVRNEIICIAGNHDLTLHPDFYRNAWKTFHPNSGPLDCNIARESLQNCIYLEDELYEHSKEIKIYGSPWTPTFFNWAFNADRDVIHEIWEKIPQDENIDILITHGPPLGRNDLCKSNVRAGCLELLKKVQSVVKPRIHVYGHIHEDSGYSYDGQTLFVNASSVNIGYQPVHPCIVIDLPLDKSLPAQIVHPCTNLDGDGVLAWFNGKIEHLKVDSNDGIDSFEDLIPFFESKSPLITGEELLNCTDFKVLACELQMHREPNWLALVQKLGRVVLQFKADSYY